MKTILIADDQPSLRLLVNATIASEAYAVIEAADGDQAWELVQRHHPELALLDIDMPGRTGLDLTRAIKSDLSLSKTRVILLTAKTEDDEVAEGIAAGADVYLTKPFSPFQLLTLVEKTIDIA